MCLDTFICINKYRNKSFIMKLWSYCKILVFTVTFAICYTRLWHSIDKNNLFVGMTRISLSYSPRRTLSSKVCESLDLRNWKMSAPSASNTKERTESIIGKINLFFFVISIHSFVVRFHAHHTASNETIVSRGRTWIIAGSRSSLSIYIIYISILFSLLRTKRIYNVLKKYLT